MKKYLTLDDYRKDNHEFFSQPIVKGFFENDSNLKLLEQSVVYEDDEAYELLDKRFVEYFYLYRLVKYISTLSFHYSIDFDKRGRRRKDRYRLILDKPIKDLENDENMYDFIAFKNGNFEIIDVDVELLDLAESGSLYKALQRLTSKEKQILNLLFIENRKQVDIAKMFGDTPQNIGKIKKKALEKLRKEMKNYKGKKGI